MCLLYMAGGTYLSGLMAQSILPSRTATLVVSSDNTRSINYQSQKETLGVIGSARKTYTVTSSESWLTPTRTSKGLELSAAYNSGTSARTAIVTVTAGGSSRTLTVTQGANPVVNYVPTLITVESASASSEETVGEAAPIGKAVDGDVSTYYHSKWYGANTSFPVTLEFTLPEGAHKLARIEYVPRNTATGIFKDVTVEVSTNGSTYTTDGSITFENNSNAQSYNLSNVQSGIRKVKLTIANSYSSFISASEIRFYNESALLGVDYTSLFSDVLCTTLKSGITQSDIDNESNTLLKSLAQDIYDGNYSTRWRVGTYQPYRPLSDLQNNLLYTRHPFCPHENPTGIFFRAGETVAIMATGISNANPVALEIHDLSPVKTNGSETTTSFSLKNGLNVITPSTQGNGYLNYYTSNYASASEVSLHIINGIQNGVFRMGDSNDDWKALLANAASSILDIVTPRVQVSAPVDVLKGSCPSNGAELAAIYDEVVRQSWDIMGYYYDNIAPANHQYIRPSYTGMFANYIGAHAPWSTFNEWANVSNFGLWGLAHELGHITQINPFRWDGMTEVTNNVCSAWVQYYVRNLTSNMNLRLEDEAIECVAGELRCGRMQNFIDEDVLHTVTFSGLKNTYNEVEYTNVGAYWDTERTIDGSDKDVFVTLVPIWQMILYTEMAGKSTDAFKKMYSDMRTNYATYNGLNNDAKRVQWLITVCNAAGLNFFPFFEKAGMLLPLDNIYVSDYSSYVYNITAADFTAAQTAVESHNYTSVPAELVYMNAYNMNLFRDNVLLSACTATTGDGCELELLNGHVMVKVDNDVWRGAVGYETYDSSGNLLHATIFGLGDEALSSRYTHVIWKLSTDTKDPAYIMAVGIDGTRKKCYE